EPGGQAVAAPEPADRAHQVRGGGPSTGRAVHPLCPAGAADPGRARGPGRGVRDGRVGRWGLSRPASAGRPGGRPRGPGGPGALEPRDAPARNQAPARFQAPARRHPPSQGPSSLAEKEVTTMLRVLARLAVPPALAFTLVLVAGQAPASAAYVPISGSGSSWA